MRNRHILILAIMAGVLYSSWPLAYLLNPAVAHSSLASELQSFSQPFGWLFITLDVLAGLALLTAGFLSWPTAAGRIQKANIISYQLFALLIIVAAIVPYNCNSISVHCAATLQAPALLVHGLASILSVVFLFTSLVICIYAARFDRKSWYGRALLGAGIAWIICGIAGLLLWHSQQILIIQNIFISLCSLTIVLVGKPRYII